MSVSGFKAIRQIPEFLPYENTLRYFGNLMMIPFVAANSGNQGKHLSCGPRSRLLCPVANLHVQHAFCPVPIGILIPAVCAEVHTLK